MATEKVPVSKNITRVTSAVTLEERIKNLGQRPATLWLTGLSGSGKSTLGIALERKLTDLGRAAFVLDGDNVRHAICRDLGFSPDDREENIRRVAEIAKLFNQAGMIVISCFIAPRIRFREMAREIIGADHFVEAYVSTPLEVCRKRDPKGLYAKVDAGEIKNFTGVSAPYEAPKKPGLTLPTHELDLENCVSLAVDHLMTEGFISA